jgi:predicted MFS family arabinose efflux permease
MVLAFVMAFLALGGEITVWEIILLSTLLGVVNAVDIPARQTFVVRMVGKADLSNAIALNSSLVNIARTVGPALGGLTVAALGEGWCFMINGVSFLAVIVALLMMRLEASGGPRVQVKTLRHMAEGMRYMRHAPRIRSVLLLLGVVSVTGVPFMVLLPVFASRFGAGGAEALGTMMAAAGIGSFLAAAPLAVVRDPGHVDIWPIWAAIGFGLTLIVFAFPAPYWLSLAILVPVGFFMMLQSAASNTVLQCLVADEMRGRVMAVYAMMFMGMIPFGSLLAGAVAERFGAAWTVAGGGAFCAAAGVVALLAYRRVAQRSETTA